MTHTTASLLNWKMSTLANNYKDVCLDIASPWETSLMIFSRKHSLLPSFESICDKTVEQGMVHKWKEVNQHFPALLSRMDNK